MTSARESCAGSPFRLVNGSTTMDSGGVDPSSEDSLAGLKPSQSPAATTRIVAMPAVAASQLRFQCLPDDCGLSTDSGEAGSAAMAFALSEYTRTGRAMFLTVCSPLSVKT